MQKFLYIYQIYWFIVIYRNMKYPYRDVFFLLYWNKLKTCSGVVARLPTCYRATTFKHDKIQPLMSGPTSVLFPTVICMPLLSTELLIVSSGIFYPCPFSPPHDFTQHSGSNRLKENLGFFVCVLFCFVFHIFLSCVSNHSSILLLSDIFSETPQPHINRTHLLSSQLSIPNRVTGLWQKMLVDLLGAQGSTGACLTCIFLKIHLVLSGILCSTLHF